MPTYEYMLLNTLEYKMFAKKKKKLWKNLRQLKSLQAHCHNYEIYSHTSYVMCIRVADFWKNISLQSVCQKAAKRKQS